MTSQTVLDRARAGDSDAFRDLVGPYRGELLAHCYRILGSLTDAEDLVQETLLAAWRALDRFEGRASVRSWLHRIAVNRCLNALRDGRRHAPLAPVPPFVPPQPSRHGDVAWLQPFPEPVPEHDPEARYASREAIELAFVVALQRMPPRQAATLILRDVLGFPGAEVADMLDTTETAVKGALQRARATLDASRDPAAVRPAGDEAATVRRFAEAFVAADIDRLVTLLTDDAWLAMPPAPHEYHGVAAIARFLVSSTSFDAGHRRVLLPTRSNNQPAFGVYLSGPATPVPHAAGLLVLTLRGDRVRALTRFHTNALLPRFGLPRELLP